MVKILDKNTNINKRTIINRINEEKNKLFNGVCLENKNIFLIDFENTTIFDFDILKEEENVCIFFIGFYQQSFFPKYLTRLKRYFDIKAKLIDFYVDRTAPNYLDNVLSYYCAKITTIYDVNKISIISQDGDYYNIPFILSKQNIEYLPYELGDDVRIFLKALLYEDDLNKIKGPKKDKNKKTLKNTQQISLNCKNLIRIKETDIKKLKQSTSLPKDFNYYKNNNIFISQNNLFELRDVLSDFSLKGKRYKDNLCLYSTFKGEMMTKISVERKISDKTKIQNIFRELFYKMVYLNLIHMFMEKKGNDITYYLKINCFF